MPYTWKEDDHGAELHLWPHQSLPPKGFAAFILGVFTLSIVPLFGLLGTKLLWGVLPFLMLVLAAMWYALRRNERDRQIIEVLSLTHGDMHLTRHNPRGAAQEWRCNPYWARVHLHEQGGPVPYYVTLSGCGREVEIGAFLSEEERKSLYADLRDKVRRVAHS